MRLIDADELTNEVIHGMAIATLHSNAKYFSIVNDIVVAFRETIDNAPTIDAEPVKHGKWTVDEKHTEEIYTNPVYCSVCGKDVVMDYGEYAPYCPNCGAKMNGDEEE